MWGVFGLGIVPYLSYLTCRPLYCTEAHVDPFSRWSFNGVMERYQNGWATSRPIPQEPHNPQMFWHQLFANEIKFNL